MESGITEMLDSVHDKGMEGAFLMCLQATKVPYAWKILRGHCEGKYAIEQEGVHYSTF